MRLGVLFPQNEIDPDPVAIRDFAQSVEGLGFDSLVAFDHVVGANPASRQGFRGLYTHESLFHEPLVLFGYLAGLTERITLATGILILPQRQTVLVAKQAAEVDVLSGGRLRLGVGIGWNRVEYQALGEDFTNRGRRSEEQIAVLRALWTNELVDFDGDWHRIEDAGLNPLPIQRPIPIWLGGMAEPVIRRVGRLADGWYPRFPSMRQRGGRTILPRRDEEPRALVERMHRYAREAGRDPASIGIEGRIFFANATPKDWRAQLDEWSAIGATDVQIYTVESGLSGVEAHVAALAAVKEALR